MNEELELGFRIELNKTNYLYHGTNIKKLKDILKEGIRPQIDAKKRIFGISKPNKIYATTVIEEAKIWANYSSNTPFEIPIVLRIPKESLKGLKILIDENLHIPHCFEIETECITSFEILMIAQRENICGLSWIWKEYKGKQVSKKIEEEWKEERNPERGGKEN